ncbi:MAG: RsmG family class I SAM-dependent methyltransferase, partial [candidate division Zixibacteria bacterium]|nr:RsmG family class I SAM-dependent methyltransferase [candidate division Zixibacteria bacterium]
MIHEPAPIEYDFTEIIRRYDPDERLERYYDALITENRKINIVSRETDRQGLMKLSVESLVPLHSICLARVKTYLDIGSGGGIPAVPILLAKEAGGDLTERTVLVERTGKKAGALRRILGSLGLKAEIVNKTFEDYTPRVKFDLITMRYIKLTRKLLRAALSTLGEDGLFVYYAQPDFKTAGLNVCA